MRLAPTALLLVLIASILAACSGSGGGCVANCSTGGSVSLVLTATPPAPTAALSIQAFTATITGITLSPASGGSPVAINLSATTYVAEFNRVTSDSALLASNVSVPVGTYNQLTISFAAPRVTSCTQPNPGVPGCASGTLLSTTGTPGSTTVATNLTVSNNALTGIALNVNLGTGLAQGSINLANAFTVSTLPREATLTDLASGQLSHLDDIMGVVTATSPTSITVETSARGPVTAATNASTIFDCAAQNSSCVQTNQVAVIDAILNSDGTITATFFEPLPFSNDLIEGVVTSVPDTISNSFALVATDSVYAPSNSVLNGVLNLGDQVVVTLAGTVQPFAIIAKGLGNPGLPGNSFAGSTSISTITPGMTVLFPVSAYSAASGTTPGTTTTDSFALRFTRITAAMAIATSPQFSITGRALPPYFGITTNQFVLTNPNRFSLDGAQTIAAIPTSNTVSASALFLAPGNSPSFLAQSVRAH